MEPDLVAVIAVVSLIGVIVGPVVTNLIVANQARADRLDARRREDQERADAQREARVAYLRETMNQLIELQADWERRPSRTINKGHIPTQKCARSYCQSTMKKPMG